MTLKELKPLVKFAREQGILTLKMAGVELAFSPDSMFPEKKKKTEEPEAPAPQTAEENFTEEQILMWSSTPPNMGEAN